MPLAVAFAEAYHRRFSATFRREVDDLEHKVWMKIGQTPSDRIDEASTPWILDT